MITQKEDNISHILSLASGKREKIKTSHDLPKHFNGNCIPNAKTTYVNDHFGSLVHQQISDKYWNIGMMNISTNRSIQLNPGLKSPLLLICCVIHGQVNFRLPGQEPVCLSRNKYNICYIPPALKEEISFDIGETEIFYIQFASKIINCLSHPPVALAKILESQKNKSSAGLVLPSVKLGIEERKTIDALKKYHSKKSIAPLFAHARISDLLFAYFSSLETTENMGDRTTDVRYRLQDSQQYIQQHYFLPLKINTLSKKAGMNIRTYEKVFKEMFHVPPKEYMRSLRIEKAAQLLKSTILPIASIAHQVGFTCGNYFSTVFRDVYGYTPTEYRTMFMIYNPNNECLSNKK